MIKTPLISRTLLFSFIILVSQNTSAQETLRDRIKERIKERRAKRVENIYEIGGIKSTSPKLETIAGPGEFNLSLVHNTVIRTYLLYIPNSYNDNSPAPLILAFHGGGGNSGIMSNDDYYGLISKSEKEGFIIVFPNGASRLKSGKLATWNAGNCCGYARDSGSDDVGFVKVLIEQIKSKLNINPRMIYAIGMSNGGMMSYRLACDLSGTITAIASVTGTDNYDNCNPSKPISILHIHAENDDHVLFNGGAGQSAFKDLSKVTEFTSVPETLSRWVKRNRCNTQPQRISGNNSFYCDLYTECEDNVEVKLCVTVDGGHSWTGASKKTRAKADTPSQAFLATDEIWEFFNQISNNYR